MAPVPVKEISLALQGGGAHGAFTWGVLDRLLEEERLAIVQISGTSAGAMNADALADGFVEGGRAGARAQLEAFWRQIARLDLASPARRLPFDVLSGNWNVENSPAFMVADAFARMLSPYDWNPLNFNPILDVMEREIDFGRVGRCVTPRIYVSATNVETGRVQVFTGDQITAKSVMASSCLPHIFQAVEIDGTPYWDGGYMGNPVLFPLFNRGAVCDVVIVQINPILRRGAPRTARAIHDRINEITFNSSLLRELRAIEFVGRLLADHRIEDDRYSRVLVHRIADDDALLPLGAASKANAEWSFLSHLRDVGRNAADRFLHAHFDDLGVRGTLDLWAQFQGPGDPARSGPEPAETP
jgi:NTE family protein